MNSTTEEFGLKLLKPLVKTTNSKIKSTKLATTNRSLGRQEPDSVKNHTTKGQLISECLFDVLNFQKTNEKFGEYLP